jgi:2'-deoxynucleoside 5'-phosphate N-hydrolase
MKVYFAGSIRGGRADVDIYREIITLLRRHGTVLTEYIGDADLKDDGSQTDKQIHEQDTEWIASADIVVAEVTRPSLGVGYELAFAECHDKKVVCLFREDGNHRISAMIAGNPRFEVHKYTRVTDLALIIERIFDARQE